MCNPPLLVADEMDQANPLVPKVYRFIRQWLINEFLLF
ncbi:hypothetical protein DB29_01807 [Shouchella clausii]|nr:hypothetical protein DB29_01807 [Shouchella clausii]